MQEKGRGAKECLCEQKRTKLAEKQQGLFRETYYVSKVELVAAGGEETLEGEWESLSDILPCD